MHSLVSSLFSRVAITVLVFAFLAGCGGGGSSSGSGSSESSQSKPESDSATGFVAVVGPNLNGNTWAGYYKSIEGQFAPLTATIEHSGNRVTIRTSKMDGVAQTFTGTIDAIGNMELIDTFDGEDWTTFYGPASANSINLADLVFSGVSIVDTNILILKR